MWAALAACSCRDSRIWTAGLRIALGDGQRALRGDGLADLVAVVGGVGHHHLCRQALDQRQGLACVTLVAGGEMEADRAAQAPLTARWILVLRPPRERPRA